MLTVDEFLAWQRSIDRHGLAGLRSGQLPFLNERCKFISTRGHVLKQSLRIHSGRF
jgi:hypothetical protein